MTGACASFEAGTEDGNRLIHAPLTFSMQLHSVTHEGRPTLSCPVCSAPCFIRGSTSETPIVKSLYAHCTNTGCTATFAAQLSFTHFINAGLISDHDVDLPRLAAEKVVHIFPPPRKSGDDGGGDQTSFLAD